jgi:hypothetical protein
LRLAPLSQHAWGVGEMGFRKRVVPRQPDYFPIFVIAILVIGFALFLANALGAAQMPMR